MDSKASSEARMQVNSSIPGLSVVKRLEKKIKDAGINDVEFFYDDQIKMWAVCQLTGRTVSTVILTNNPLPSRPFLMWWVKHNDGTFRMPSEEDVHNVIVSVTKAREIWNKPKDWLADQLDEKDIKKRQTKKDSFREQAGRLSRDTRNSAELRKYFADKARQIEKDLDLDVEKGEI